MQTLKTTETKEIQVKDDENLVRQSMTLVEEANSLVIKDDLSCQRASDLCETLKAFLKGPGTYHDEEISLADKMHKLLCAKRNRIIEGPRSAYKRLKDEVALWLDEQKRKREEAERKAQEEARRKEEEKQRKIQEKIEAEQRRVREQQEEEARIQREKEAAIKAAKDEEERARLEREELARREAEERRLKEEQEKAARKTEILEEKKETIYVAPKPVAAVAAPKGVSIRYEYEPIVESKELVPEMYKVVDLKMLKDMQEKAKGQLVVPGVRFNKKPIGSIRGAA